jgi:hypothetical protein
MLTTSNKPSLAISKIEFMLRATPLPFPEEWHKIKLTGFLRR